MQCKCGGVLIEGKSTYRTSKKNFSFILENVPAYKCMRCDEVMFSEAVKDKLQQIVNRIERDSDEIVTGRPSANLYDY
jgi:YgiT-type zinc finger domain-containing protein